MGATSTDVASIRGNGRGAPQRPVLEPSLGELTGLAPAGAKLVSSRGRGWHGLQLAHMHVPAVELPEFASRTRMSASG
jgi:hypothetical protein